MKAELYDTQIANMIKLYVKETRNIIGNVEVGYFMGTGIGAKVNQLIRAGGIETFATETLNKDEVEDIIRYYFKQQGFEVIRADFEKVIGDQRDPGYTKAILEVKTNMRERGNLNEK